MTFAAGNPTATSSGYKLVEQFVRAGLHHGDLKIEYRGNAEENPRLVADGRFQAGVAQKDKLRGSHANSLRILCEFPTTTMPWASRAELEPNVRRAFTEALVAVKDRTILLNLPDDATLGFKSADPAYFQRLDEDMRRVDQEFLGPVTSPAMPGGQP